LRSTFKEKNGHQNGRAIVRGLIEAQIQGPEGEEELGGGGPETVKRIAHGNTESSLQKNTNNEKEVFRARREERELSWEKKKREFSRRHEERKQKPGKGATESSGTSLVKECAKKQTPTHPDNKMKEKVGCEKTVKEEMPVGPHILGDTMHLKREKQGTRRECKEENKQNRQNCTKRGGIPPSDHKVLWTKRQEGGQLGGKKERKKLG